MLLPLPQVWRERIASQHADPDLLLELKSGVYHTEQYFSLLLSYWYFVELGVHPPFHEEAVFEGASPTVEEYLDGVRDLVESPRKFVVLTTQGDPSTEVLKWGWGKRKAMRTIPLAWKGQYVRVKLLEWTKDGYQRAWADSVYPTLYPDFDLYHEDEWR